MAMDHTHCFTCGRELNSAIGHIDAVNDERVYGLFPNFRELISKHAVGAYCDKLAAIDRAYVAGVVADSRRMGGERSCAFGVGRFHCAAR
jgi:hypothetical protein